MQPLIFGLLMKDFLTIFKSACYLATWLVFKHNLLLPYRLWDLQCRHIFIKSKMYMVYRISLEVYRLNIFVKCPKKSICFYSFKLLVGTNELNLMQINKSVIYCMGQRGNELLFDVKYRTCVRHWVCSSQDFRIFIIYPVIESYKHLNLVK